jgi:hypothetical protein
MSGGAASADAPQRRVPRGLLHGPIDVFHGFEISVHECPKAIKRELAQVFYGVSVDNILLVPTAQRASLDLVNFSNSTTEEKDRLLVKASHH